MLLQVYTEKNRCKRELELALTIKDLAVAVGNDNVTRNGVGLWRTAGGPLLLGFEGKGPGMQNYSHGPWFKTIDMSLF